MNINAEIVSMTKIAHALKIPLSFHLTETKHVLEPSRWKTGQVLSVLHLSEYLK